MYEWVEHTGELELAIRAPTEAAVFEEAAAALAELLGDGLEGEPLRRVVAVHADDRPALLVEWIGELVYLAESERLVVERVTSIDLEPDALEATVEGRAGEPPALVKGATYHRLELGPDGDEWHARVVLDV